MNCQKQKRAAQGGKKAGAAPVELHGALGLEGQPQPHQQVGEALDADADRAVAEVGSARLLDRVVVDVDHVVQVAPAQIGNGELAKTSTRVYEGRMNKQIPRRPTAQGFESLNRQERNSRRATKTTTNASKCSKRT